MSFKTFKDFTEEWGEPNDLNFAIRMSRPDKEYNLPWSVDIAQPRKGRIMEVFIEKAKPEQMQDWWDKSVVVMKEQFK
jgi:hypothetical protein